MHKNYKFIFFDLDKTLWDFDKNSEETLKEIFKNHNLNNYFKNFNTFYSTYNTINEKLWGKYAKLEITKKELKTERFYMTLKAVGISDLKLSETINIEYINESPKKKSVFPNTYELLEYLTNKYKLAIITNGFKEIQFEKLKNCELDKYFTKVICPEDSGFQKPNKKMFQYSLSSLNAKKEHSIMVGDDLNVDIIGASNFGIDTIYFNPKSIITNKPSYEVNYLLEITKVL